MFNVGPGELIVIMAIALIFFGPKKLPEIGRSIGNAMKEFRKASNEFMDAMHQPAYEEEPAPPVKSVEYPSSPALSGTENYETLPYGSDFYPTDATYASDPANPDAMAAAYGGTSDTYNASEYNGSPDEYEATTSAAVAPYEPTAGDDSLTATASASEAPPAPAAGSPNGVAEGASAREPVAERIG